MAPRSVISKNRYIGAVSLGSSPAGTRIGKKVTGRTKTEVRDNSGNCISKWRAGCGLDGATPWVTHSMAGLPSAWMVSRPGR